MMEKANLKELYQKLELTKDINAKDTDYVLEIKFGEILNDEEIELIKIERKILSLMFNKGKLISRFFTPEIVFDELFSDYETDYIKERIENTQNTYITIRYLIILWNKTKNQEYSKIAFDKTFNILKKEIKSKNITFGDANELFLICRKIVEKTKYRKEEYLNYLQNFKNNISTPYDFYSYLEQLVDNKLISSILLKTLLSDYRDYIKFEIQYYFPNQYGFEILIPLIQKAKLPIKELYSLMAENENVLINHRKENDFVKLNLLRKKADYEKLAGKTVDSEQTLEELTKIKFDVNLNKVDFSMSSETNKGLEILWEIIDSKSSFLSTLSAEYIIGYFATQFDNLHTVTTEKGNKSLFDGHFTTILMDINNNANEKKSRNSLSENISTYYSLFFMPIFEQTLYKSILNGHLNYQNFSNFLKGTWIGQPTKFYKGDIEIEESWLTLLQPGLYNFFSLFEYQTIHNKLKTDSFILSIDSLTLKFEGILRDFIRLCGGTTIKIKNGISEEILLEEMLEHKVIKETYEEAEIELFKLVFTRQGLNIRNDIAHGFYKLSDYNLKKISLILLCILRISRFEFGVEQ
ncbi:DUF4209 domain-containing protein [Chryseobacterium sp. RG1]|uniref:DUF4209 domain-containing protein n=1 Tax=Chryseobacterium tagetis TaxID=2801334 RepID=A0ABS8A4R0_9FLAO|nr:DUF4209 domain-containing protein [Chryseobacterium tagetis]MCA6068966.1 DUF4209 domain-containing protein [Chryseobacterium tagetis]